MYDINFVTINIALSKLSNMVFFDATYLDSIIIDSLWIAYIDAFSMLNNEDGLLFNNF